MKSPMGLFATIYPEHVEINQNKKWWHFWKETYVFTDSFLNKLKSR